MKYCTPTLRTGADSIIDNFANLKLERSTFYDRIYKHWLNVVKLC